MSISICQIPGARILRPRRLLILGAGKDAEPLIGLAQILGWQVIVFDHRPAYIETAAVKNADAVHCADAAQVAELVDLGRIDAAIIMSHHLVSDKEYLGVLAESSVDFIGLIGPPQRRDRLLADLGEKAALFEDRLRAPVGTQIGGRGPAAIALEIAAELQAYFSADRN